MNKTIKAELKETIFVSTDISVDWHDNPLVTSDVVQTVKEEQLLMIREKMHEKIALLTINDLKFSIMESNK